MRLALAFLAGLVVAGVVGYGYTRVSSETTTRTITVGHTITHAVTTTVTTTASAAGNACAASDLTGTFIAVAGSEGAGNIVYTLRATNASQDACTVSGFPTIDFLTSGGAVLPSKVSTTTEHVAVVTLQPGDTATSQVRFSPGVDPCDSGTATTIRTTLPDGTTFTAKIDPATKLCGAGSLQPSPWAGAA
jgi:hypothetical protein